MSVSPIIVCRNNESEPRCPVAMNPTMPMRPVRETHRHVVYQCRTCLVLRVVPKTVCGGTIGAGDREDRPPLTYAGRGV